MEAYLFMIISTVSEIDRKDTDSYAKVISYSLSILFAIICGLFIILVAQQIFKFFKIVEIENDKLFMELFNGMKPNVM
jgi:hypothetical protein